MGFVGKTPRIGVTTLALQITKWLSEKNYRVAYIQANNSGYVEALNDCYENVECDKEVGLVRYKNIDLYCSPEKINEIKRFKYDFYIYDYGNDESKYNEALKDDKLFVVCGTSPSELNDTQDLIEQFFEKDNIYFCFNFASNGERDDILENMEDMADKTFFLNNTPTPFELVTDNWDSYEKILSFIETKEEVEEVKPKHRFFARKRNV